MSPRQRRRVVRGGMYVVLVVAIVLAGLFADWSEIERVFLDLEIAASMFPEVILLAAKNTVLYTATAFSFGLVLGLILALMKLSSIGPYRWIASTFIEVFRGLPALVTILFVGFMVPIAFGGDFIPGGFLGKATVGLGIVGAAYMAETIRAGIVAVPKGQMEAARSLGMSRTWAMTSIVIPQAFRIIIPPMTNELVLLIKDTSLLFVLGTTPITLELTKFGRDFASENLNGTPFIVIALAYLAITVPLTQLVAQLERRQARAR